MRRARSRFWIVIGLTLFAASRCRDQQTPPAVGRTAEAPRGDEAAIERALADGAAPSELRDGVAAAIVVDVSGSMQDRVVDTEGRRARKIDVARRAARDVVAQFAAYAAQHRDEPVSLGIFEFSRRDGQPDCRPVLPMGPPDLAGAEAALARLDPDGGTPIGAALITATQALTASGLSRRHLLLVSDGENTDGFAPEDVAAAIAKRPETDRPAIYFVAFDVAAERFARVRDAGALVLSAANARELNETFDTLITGKILVEK